MAAFGVVVCFVVASLLLQIHFIITQRKIITTQRIISEKLMNMVSYVNKLLGVQCICQANSCVEIYSV